MNSYFRVLFSQDTGHWEMKNDGKSLLFYNKR